MIHDIKDVDMCHGDFYIAKCGSQNRHKNGKTSELEAFSNAKHGNPLESQEQRPTLSAPLCDIVPLYGCECLKSQVVANANIKGRLQGTLGPENNRRRLSSNQLQGSNSLTSNYAVQFGIASDGLHGGKAERKSYVDLHYAKIGYPHVKGGGMVKRQDTMNTVRGVYGNETTRSNESVLIDSVDGEFFEDAQSCLSDTTSFYEHFMEKEIILNASGDDLSDLKSISQVSTKQKNPSIRNMKNKTKSIISVPVLSSLGPDPLATKVKMDKLRKRQTYGQKASEQNRIKIMEKKILLGLKSEMNKSIDLDKKDFSKFIEDDFNK